MLLGQNRNIFITLAIIICYLSIQIVNSLDMSGMTLNPTELEVGCYDSTDCANTSCRRGCVDCESQTECNTCQYGYFLFHTPENTIECVECPYYDVFGKAPNQIDYQQINQCATCLEMPDEWEYIRKCTFKYTFFSNDQSYTPQNTTLNKPEIFKIVYDTNEQQDFLKTRYYAEQLTPNCDSYTWKNYYVTAKMTQDLIDKILISYNEQTCDECQVGYIMQEDQNCAKCSLQIDKCSACYENPKTKALACTICDSGYTPTTNQDECVQCSSQIDNCDACYLDSQFFVFVCTTCATGYRVNDNDECEQQVCEDPNCTNCLEANDVCDTCKNRFELSNDECISAQACNFGLQGPQCKACHAYVNANEYPYNDPDLGLTCLLCNGEDLGGGSWLFECESSCPDGYGFNEDAVECVPCQSDPNCTACYTPAGGSEECFQCATGFGFDTVTQSCFSCAAGASGTSGVTGCQDCEIYDDLGRNVFECFECQEGFGLMLEDATGRYTCKPCADEDVACTKCDYTDNGDGTFDIDCFACNSPLLSPKGIPATCQDNCNDSFGGQCDNSMCLLNPDYNQYSSDTTIFPAQGQLCQKCRPGYSLNSSGNECVENIFLCRNSLQYSARIAQTINPFYDYNSGQTPSSCYNGCFIAGGAPAAGETFFQDPILKKCILCVGNRQMCRRKIEVNRFVICNSSIDDGSHSSVLTNGETVISGADNLTSDLFNFDFTGESVGDWNLAGVSQIDLNVYFVGGTPMQKDMNVCSLPYGLEEVDITSNISEGIFKLININYNIRTIQYSNIATSPTTYNDIQIELRLPSYAETWFTITKISAFSMSKILFTPDAGFFFEDIVEQMLFSFTVEDCLPMVSFTLDNVSFESKENFHLVPIFDFIDLGSLTLNNFSYESKKTTSEQLTGHQMFKFRKYQGFSKKLIIDLKKFTLKNFLLVDVMLFQVYEKKATISMNQITLQNVIFKNSYFLRDIAVGFGNGEQWYEITNLNVRNVQLYDSSIFYIRNAMFFYGDNWNFLSMHSALGDNEKQSIVDVNTFRIRIWNIETLTLYKTNILNQAESPSTVVYYFDENVLQQGTFSGITVYLAFELRIFNILGNLDVQIDGLDISNLIKADSLKLNYNLKTYAVNEDYGVNSISSFQITALTDIVFPEFILSIINDSIGSTVTIEQFFGKQLGDMSLFEMQNIDNVIIKNFQCGGNYVLGDDQINFYQAICLQAYTSKTDTMQSFTIVGGDIKFINYTEGSPIKISGYEQTILDSVLVYHNMVGQGFQIIPQDISDNDIVSIVKFIDCQFSNIRTQICSSTIVNSGAIFVDTQKISNVNQFQLQVTGCTFEAITSRYQAAGIYVTNPLSIMTATIETTTFKNMIAFNGAAILMDCADRTSSTLTMTDVTITGPGEEQYFTYVDTDRQISFSFMGYDEYFFEVKWLIDGCDNYVKTEDILTIITPQSRNLQDNTPNQDQQIIIPDSVKEEQQKEESEQSWAQDTYLYQASQQPSQLRLININVQMTGVTIQDVYLQQGLTITDSFLVADNLTIKNINCQECSTFGGSNYIFNTLYTISNSNFEQNKSKLGGALHIKSTPHFSKISDSTFTKNIAQKQGGAIYIKDTLFQLDTITFDQNEATGNYDDPSNPMKGEAGGIYTEVSTTLDCVSIENFATCCVAQATDSTASCSRRQLAAATSDYQITVSNVKFTNNKAEIGASGRFTGEQPVSISGITYSGNVATLYGEELLETCVYGEGKATDGTCSVCPEGQYSLDQEGQTCKVCMDGAKCLGGDRIIINAEYWRPNNYSESVVYCANMPSNCLQGEEYSNFTCADGHLGALCEGCDLHGKYTSDGAKYSVSSSYTCGRCDDQQTNAIKVAAMNLWVLFSMLLAVKGTIKLVQDKIQLRAIWVLFPGFRSKDDETGILIKMFTNYAQIIVILSTFELSLPTTFTDVQDIAGNPVKSLGNTLDCYLVEIQDTIPNIYFKIMWMVLMNILQLLAFLILFGIAKLIKKTRIPFYYLFWTTVIYLLIYLQPSYVNSILATISCRKVGGYDYILADVGYQCHTDEYNLWSYIFLIPFLIFWVVILPAIMAYVLIKNYRAGTLQTAVSLYSYGFLYQEYKEEAYYWELVKVFQKTLIVAVIQLYSDDIKEKAILVFEIVFVYAIFTYYKRPYDSKKLNELDITSSIVCCLSLITGVFIWKNDYIYWKIIGFAIIFIINAWFVILMIYKILAKFRSDINKKHADKIEKVKLKLPFLRKIFKQSPDSILKTRQHWKVIKEAVNLYIDGKQAGCIKVITPPLPNYDQINELNNSKDLLVKEGIDYKSDKDEKDALSVINSSQNIEGEQVKVEIKQQQPQQPQPQKRKKQDQRRNSLMKNNPIMKPRSKISQNSIAIPQIERSKTKEFHLENTKIVCTSVDILSGQATEEQKAEVRQIVESFRSIKIKEYNNDRIRFKEYFMEELKKDKQYAKLLASVPQPEDKQSNADSNNRKVHPNNAIKEENEENGSKASGLESHRMLQEEVSPSPSHNENQSLNNQGQSTTSKKRQRKVNNDEPKFNI